MTLHNPRLAEEIQRQATSGLETVSLLEAQTEDVKLRSILTAARNWSNDAMGVLVSLSNEHSTGTEAHALKSAELLLGMVREHINTVRDSIRE